MAEEVVVGGAEEEEEQEAPAAAAAPGGRWGPVPWTQAETTLLKRGVETFGEGRWDTVLETYKERFALGRTAEELCEQWRPPSSTAAEEASPLEGEDAEMEPLDESEHPPPPPPLPAPSSCRSSRRCSSSAAAAASAAADDDSPAPTANPLQSKRPRRSHAGAAATASSWPDASPPEPPHGKASSKLKASERKSAGDCVWFTATNLPQVLCSKAPQQGNDYDCGLFMLHFIETLCTMKELPSFETVDGLQQAFGKTLFTQDTITKKRDAVHDLLKQEYNQQHGGLELKD